jgi:predicted enzyme related to lactoylglutathione lyase
MGQLSSMEIRRVVPNIASKRLDESREFYTSIFGFKVGMQMGPMVTLVSPNNPTAQVSIIGGPDKSKSKSKSEPEPSITLTIEVADVDEVHRRATAHGLRIVRRLTTEPWGVRRFVVVDPNGTILNVMSHTTKK